MQRAKLSAGDLSLRLFVNLSDNIGAIVGGEIAGREASLSCENDVILKEMEGEGRYSPGIYTPSPPLLLPLSTREFHAALSTVRPCDGDYISENVTITT